MKTICGVDCSKCAFKDNCKGCMETNGHPLGGECVAAKCYQSGGEKCFLQYKFVADNDYLLLCEYGCNGAEPEIVIYKKR